MKNKSTYLCLKENIYDKQRPQGNPFLRGSAFVSVMPCPRHTVLKFNTNGKYKTCHQSKWSSIQLQWSAHSPYRQKVPNSKPGGNSSTSKLWVFLVAQTVKNLPAMWETWVRFLGWEDPLEEGMTTHSNMLAWRIPMDRGARQAKFHGITKSQTQLSNLSTHTTHIMYITH